MDLKWILNRNFGTFVPNCTQLPILETVNQDHENLEFYVEITQQRYRKKAAKCAMP
jgi:hypothetical protein